MRSMFGDVNARIISLEENLDRKLTQFQPVLDKRVNSEVTKIRKEVNFTSRKIVRPMLTESFSFNYILKSKFSLSRHFEYANEQITYHFWLCAILVWPLINLVYSIHNNPSK
jgi:hypothetical protein